jgi:hypothetical protein
VDSDEVVPVGLGVLTGQELLSSVLGGRRDHRRGDLGSGLGMLEGRLGREVDLLLGELAVDIAVYEAVTPGQQTACDHQDDDDNDTGAAGEDVEDLASHGVLLWQPKL